MRAAWIRLSADAKQPVERGVLVVYCCVINHPNRNTLKQQPFIISRNSWNNWALLAHMGLQSPVCLTRM